jgi:hypothetical protein
MAETMYPPWQPITYGDITRSTEPMWRSVRTPHVYSNIRITTTPDISGGMFYFIAESGMNEMRWVDHEPVDPNMQLPPGF